MKQVLRFMLGRLVVTVLVLLLLLIASHSYAQEAPPQQPVSSGYVKQVSAKARMLKQKLDKRSAKVIAQLQKQEKEMRRKLAKIDSAAAGNMLTNANAAYKQLEGKPETPCKLKEYIPHLDSVSSSLNFLSENSQLLSRAKEVKDKLKNAISNVNALKGQLQKAEEIKKFLKERKQYMGHTL